MGFKESLTEAFNRLSGKSVEEKVNEYSEVYGEILFGMNREIESSKRMLAEYRAETNKLAKTIGGLQASISDKERELNKWIQEAKAFSAQCENYEGTIKEIHTKLKDDLKTVFVWKTLSII